MIGEVWTYKATNPSDNIEKVRPVLIIGNDSDNQLKFVDIHYVIISSSADCGKYDVEMTMDDAKKIGLDNKSVIKTTKIYTGSKSKLRNKIGILPKNKKEEFIDKFIKYQKKLIDNLI